MAGTQVFPTVVRSSSSRPATAGTGPCASPSSTRGAMIRTRSEIGCKLVWRRQWSPHKAKDEKNDSVGEVFSHESCAGRTGQNQTRHGAHPLHTKTKRALNTSATQRSQ